MTKRARPESFEQLFEQAMSSGDTSLRIEPHEYQVRMAEAGRLPAALSVPTGSGKTGIVLVWLWLRLFAEVAIRDATPRRLIIALPFRSLTEQTHSVVARWLSNLGLQDEVDLHLLMGGRANASRSWRSQPERNSIAIGTIDMLVSKGLFRGYGTARGLYPMDASLVLNDAHIVIDEVQAALASTATLRQLDAFRRSHAADHVGPVGLTCMSATLPREPMDTIDNPFPSDDIVTLAEPVTSPDLLRRLSGTRTVRGLGTQRPADVAKATIELHRPGTLTLAVMNQIKVAADLYSRLRKLAPAVDIVLLHSRFRPVERETAWARLCEPVPPAGRIVVATQVIEAGIDLDAHTMITEAAPWSALRQRAGRCNRAGRADDAVLAWYSPLKNEPYEKSDLAASAAALRRLDGQAATTGDLAALAVDETQLTFPVLRRLDFEGLFDTSPDLSGFDLDIQPYVRDADELDVLLWWWPLVGAKPDDSLRTQSAQWQCRAPVSAVFALLKRNAPVWRYDQESRSWQRVDQRHRPRIGEVLLVDAAAGGYDVELGLDPLSTKPVSVFGDESDPDQVETGFSAEPRSFGGVWLPLDQHLRESAEQAELLVADLPLTSAEKDDVILAARIHDIGKAHPLWQRALVRTASAVDADHADKNGPWAKSAASSARLSYGPGIRQFRHEFVSLLLLDGPMAGLLDGAHDRALVRYLVLSHHGKIRMQVRDPYADESGRILGVAHEEVADIPAVLGQPPLQLEPDLRRFALGVADGDDLVSWTTTAAGLLDKYGPYRLSYLETMVRLADWRASALHDTPASGGTS